MAGNIMVKQFPLKYEDTSKPPQYISAYDSMLERKNFELEEIQEELQVYKEVVKRLENTQFSLIELALIKISLARLIQLDANFANNNMIQSVLNKLSNNKDIYTLEKNNA